METHAQRLTPITDHRGEVITPDAHEPMPGSIVLSQGIYGTAWQRFFFDGLWHAVGRSNGGVPWSSLLLGRNLVLVYDAPQREDYTPVIFPSHPQDRHRMLGPVEALARVDHAHLDTGECIKRRDGGRCES